MKMKWPIEGQEIKIFLNFIAGFTHNEYVIQLKSYFDTITS